MLFLSYTSTEKESIIMPFNEEIKKYGISLWIDKEKIYNGCEIYNGICTAIESCESGIAFISPQFLNKFWTMHELELMYKQSFNNPNYKLYIVLCGISKEKFRKEFPKIKYISYDCYYSSDDIFYLAQRIASAYYHNINTNLTKYNNSVLKNKSIELFNLINIYSINHLQRQELFIFSYIVVEFCKNQYSNYESIAEISIYRIIIENLYSMEIFDGIKTIESPLIIFDLLEIYLKKLIQVI